MVEMLKCSRGLGDSSHRLAVERKVPTTNRIRNEHFVAATAPRLATSEGSRVSRPQTCLAMAERDRGGDSRCGPRGHFRSFQSQSSFVRIEGVDYGTRVLTVSWPGRPAELLASCARLKGLKWAWGSTREEVANRTRRPGKPSSGLRRPP